MMAKEIPDWAQVGAEIVHVRNHFGGRANGYGAITKVAARLGNGNIKIEGHPGQWRPGADGRAHLAGTDSYSRSTIRHVTEELRPDIELDRRYRAALSKIDDEATRLTRLSRTGTREEVIAAAALLPEPANA